MTVLNDTSQFACPQGAELLLDLGEDEFDGIVLRAVGYVKDTPKAQSSHFQLRLLAPVGGEVIHEESNLLFSILPSKL